jgi:hypothetical protein
MSKWLTAGVMLAVQILAGALIRLVTGCWPPLALAVFWIVAFSIVTLTVLRVDTY